MLLWSCIQLNKIRKQEEWKTKLIGQIHDEINKDVYPTEEDHIKETIERIMVKDTQKQFPWLVIPLLAEYKSGEIDQSWAMMKK
jgi:DNA polymerase I-like protein with 3'-5' exonuclease and polymerase domains